METYTNQSASRFTVILVICPMEGVQADPSFFPSFRFRIITVPRWVQARARLSLSEIKFWIGSLVFRCHFKDGSTGIIDCS